MGALGAAGVVGLGPGTVATGRPQSGPYPYHPLLFHLDLSILAYQLYGQSLVWPFDPYYEHAGNRKKMVQRVYAQLEKSAGEYWPGTGLDKIRGPDVTLPEDKAPLDPILYRYSQIDPHRSCLSRPHKNWVWYTPVPEICERIGRVYVVYRDQGERVHASMVKPAGGPANASVSAAAPDELYCFEGVTGKKSEGDAVSRSLLGFVLKRRHPDGGYDIHIAFRGSRSGKLPRTARKAYHDHKAAGNPDWATDLGCNRTGRSQDITETGDISRGFKMTIREVKDCLEHCLTMAAAAESESSAPRQITVTGHSLGGALAQCFVSSELLGTRRPTGDSLGDWPWEKLKLVTYSAPRAGTKDWAQALTEKLEANFWETTNRRWDSNALSPANEEIVARMQDPGRAAAYRVLLSNDPLTTKRNLCHGGEHVGTTVYADNESSLGRAGRMAAHEPAEVRKYLLDQLTPKPAGGAPWVTERDVRVSGWQRDHARVVHDIIAHHQEMGESFDADGLHRDLEMYNRIRSDSEL